MYKKFQQKNNIKFNSKRAISPVVATALLIVVGVVAVVGFQTFFTSYSSGLFTKVDTQSDASVGGTQIDNLIGNSLYFKNSNTENITINSIKIEGNPNLRKNPPTRKITIETYNDHRVAMSFALIGLRTPGIIIKNPACVSKTFPDFFERLASL